jgi:hypothetical protein
VIVVVIVVGSEPKYAVEPPGLTTTTTATTTTHDHDHVGILDEIRGTSAQPPEQKCS